MEEWIITTNVVAIYYGLMGGGSNDGRSLGPILLHTEISSYISHFM
jgi:hypothetical protein